MRYNVLMAPVTKENIGFRPIDQIPYPKLFEPNATAPRLQRQLLDVLGGISVRQGRNKDEDRITLGDLKGAPPELTFEDFVSHFYTQLGLDESKFSEKEKQTALMLNINSALNAARHFISEGYGIVLDQDAVNVHPESLREVYEKIIRQTATFSPKKGLIGSNRLNRQASFCLLVLETISALELQKKEFGELQVDGSKVREMLVQSPAEAGDSFFHSVGNIFDEYVEVVPNTNFVSDLNLPKPLGVRYRNKTHESQMVKLGRKPEAQYDLREALPDEIGFEITFPRIKSGDQSSRDVRTIQKVIAKLVAHIKKNNQARNVVIENVQFFSSDDLKGLIAALHDEGIQLGSDFAFGSDTLNSLAIDGQKTNLKNVTSSAAYESLKFTYSLDVSTPKKGIRERNIEIQIADEISTSHSLDEDHRIYRVRQFINLLTRRFGGCSREWIMWKINQALNSPGSRLRVKPETVLNLLILKGKIVELPGIAKRHVYADPSVIKRQVRAGLYDGTTIPREVHDLEHAAKGRVKSDT